MTRARVVVHVEVGPHKIATVRAYDDGALTITPPNPRLVDAIQDVARSGAWGGEWVAGPIPGAAGYATLDGDRELVALTIARGVYVVMPDADCRSRYLWNGDNDPPGRVYGPPTRS
jgi:hypothetical protein